MSALAQTADSRLAPETRAWVQAKLYASIQLYFAHAEGAPEFDLDRDFQTYLKAASTDDRRQFDLATMAFMGKLRNGHSGFYDTWLFQHHGQDIGFWALPMAEGWVVVQSRLAGVEPGDVAVSVDGKPFEQFYREIDPLIEGSSERARKRKFCGQAWLWPESFDLGLANGSHVAVHRATQKLGPRRSFPASQAPAMPEGAGYIRIRSFAEPRFENDALRQVKALMSSKAIVIDVRGNGGGATPSALIRALLDRPWRDFRYTTPVSNGHVGAQARIRSAYPEASAEPYERGYLDAFAEFDGAQLLAPATLHAAAPDAYRGKLYLLVDGDCASACDDFAEALQTSGRAVLIGESTHGSSGQPYLFDFGNGMTFRVSTKRYYLPDGSPFEGVGIRPDVEIVPALADYRTGRDPVYAKAIELAAK